MNEIAIQEVKLYIEECLFEPRYNWPADIFEERSYSRWAAFEIIQRLMDQPFVSPILIIEGFMYEMASRSHIEEDLSKDHMFQIARDTAEDILCLFL